MPTIYTWAPHVYVYYITGTLVAVYDYNRSPCVHLPSCCLPMTSYMASIGHYRATDQELKFISAYATDAPICISKVGTVIVIIHKKLEPPNLLFKSAIFGTEIKDLLHNDELSQKNLSRAFLKNSL